MRILLITSLALLLCAGNSLAAADLWADDPVIKDNPESSTESSEPVEVNATNPASGAMTQPGAYFGADGYPLPGWGASGNDDRSVEYNGQTIYFPEYGQANSQLYENVYGPMWGVPADAVGLDGYDPYYYYLMMMSDPSQLSAEQRREIEERVRQMQQTSQAPAPGPASSSDDSPSELEGINMTDDYWD